MIMKIDLNVARKLLKTVDAGLVRGLGNPKPGEMCVEAAVCYALGLEHGDDPGCVAPSLRALKIRLNDSRWSSKAARAKGLRRLALVQLGSVGTLDEKEFAKRCATLAIGYCVPVALRAAAKEVEAHRQPLLDAVELCEKEPTRENALRAREVATAAAADGAADAAHAADASSSAAAYATAAAAIAAAAAAAAADAAADAVYTDTADIVLSTFAERVVQILIDMKAPGCQWLYLTEAA